MAGWERRGEGEKYAAENAGQANVNPRHVGTTLRTISMDERIEERKKMKQAQKQGAIQMSLSDDEEEEEPAPKPAESAECKKVELNATSADSSTTTSTKNGREPTESTAVSGKEPHSLVAMDVDKVPPARELVEDLDAVVHSNGSEQIKGKGSKRAVEDLDAVAVVELDSVDSPASARKARRKAAAAKAKCSPRKSQVLVLLE